MRADGFHENFGSGLVSAATRLHRRKINAAKSPIAVKHAVAIGGRELKMAINSHTRRRTAASRHQNIYRVEVIVGPCPASQVSAESPPMMASITYVIQPRGRVPRQQKLAFPIAVVSENVAQ